MRKKLLFALCSIIFSISISAASTPSPTFKKIVFFGDSLSDNGNLYSHTNYAIPGLHYYQGRFTNGYTWADDISHILYKKYDIVSENYAVGGATAVLQNPFAGSLPVTLPMEVADYNARYFLSDKSDTLYVIWIGANDYFPGQPNVEQATTDVISVITSTVQSLSENNNAQFFIAGLPDLSLTPQATMRHLVENYKALTVLHNQKLHAAIIALKKQFPNTKITEFSFIDHPILEQMVHSPAFLAEMNQKYHMNITNVTDACWGGGFFKSTGESTKLSKMIAESPALTEAYRVQQLPSDPTQHCATPEQYIFWDEVHPTETMHKVIAEVFAESLLNDA